MNWSVYRVPSNSTASPIRRPNPWRSPAPRVFPDRVPSSSPTKSAPMLKPLLLVTALAFIAPHLSAQAPATPAPLQTEFVYEAVVTIDAGVEVGTTPGGTRRYIPITGGT